MGFLEELVQQGVISQADVQSARKIAAESGESVDTVLVKNKGVDERELMRIKGEYMNMPVRVLDEKVPYDVLKYIPEESARHSRFVPLGVRDGTLEVGVTDPDNIEGMDALQFISTKIGMPFKIFLIPQSDFEETLNGYQGLSGQMGTALSELETDISAEVNKVTEDKSIPGLGDGKKDDESMRVVEDAPVTKMVAVILRHATEGNASDIHIEPIGEKIRVRFRVDGVLNTSILLPPAVHSSMVARIKILSNLKLDEKRKPQDGRFSAKIDSRKVDFRVSTFPTYFGEKVVMRILDSEKGVKPLAQLGLRDENLKLISDAIERPYGMVLITGPTGSGKSTTLYSMLNELDRERDNIISLEDPVEYNIPGVNQSQVKPEIGYTFASGLRSVLRQDPDVIMVGEIRDKETAQLAVQAALTGHLVLSTLHTNTAAGAVPRLIDMGVDPYLIAPTLILSIGQRLVRRMCDGAGKPIPTEGSIRAMIDHQFEDLPEEYRTKLEIPENVYEATSTPECPVGVKGREAVFEVLSVDRDIEEVILRNPVEIEVYKAARKKGMLTMKEDAMMKAFKGIVPFTEVNSL